jgi:hypothetical protein
LHVWPNCRIFAHEFKFGLMNSDIFQKNVAILAKVSEEEERIVPARRNVPCRP